MTTNCLPNLIILPGDVIAKLGVVPMPKSNADGRYEPRRDHSVSVGLFRGEKLIELRPVGTVICGEPKVELTDGSKLDEAGIEALDFEDWDQLLDSGVTPVELVLQIPR